MVTPLAGSRIGWDPPARSTMERRAWPSASPSRSSARWASGPRCLRLAAMRRSRPPKRSQRSLSESPKGRVKPAIPDMATASGGSYGEPLPLHEGAHLGERIEGFRNELRVPDLDAVLLLQEGDELQHAQRIDDAAAQERILVGENVHEEGFDDECPDAGARTHPLTWEGPARRTRVAHRSAGSGSCSERGSRWRGCRGGRCTTPRRSEEHTSELQSRGHLVC